MKQFRNHLLLVACLGGMSMGLCGMAILMSTTQRSLIYKNILKHLIAHQDRYGNLVEKDTLTPFRYKTGMNYLSIPEKTTAQGFLLEYNDETNRPTFLWTPDGGLPLSQETLLEYCCTHPDFVWPPHRDEKRRPIWEDDELMAIHNWKTNTNKTKPLPLKNTDIFFHALNTELGTQRYTGPRAKELSSRVHEIRKVNGIKLPKPTLDAKVVRWKQAWGQTTLQHFCNSSKHTSYHCPLCIDRLLPAPKKNTQPSADAHCDQQHSHGEKS